MFMSFCIRCVKVALVRAGLCCLGIFILNLIVPYILGTESTMADAEDSYMDFWFVRLSVNLLGYATIFVPGYLLIRYLRKVRYDETAGTSSPGFFQQLAKLCVFGKENEHNSEANSSGGKTTDPLDLSKSAMVLIVCFLGLQGSYLTWGLLQERIMTFEYGASADTKGEYFKNSQFLVFINRILAFTIGIVVLFMKKQPPHTAPLYKYSYSSFSNIMSSWFQYEALKFVSFPTQVLAKASKVIPVMLMGKVVSKKTYEYHEYITAGMISLGVGLFLLTSGDVTRDSTKTTTIAGVIMLVGYMSFDSFTSNWQGELFKTYKMSSIQMMAGVNMFSCLLTSVALIEQGGFVECIAFMFKFPTFVVHAVILSLCSACGQLFIFYTIERFGPVTFTIIMTLRQAFAILLSCIIYGHPLTFLGIIGVCIVFLALFLRIYANQRACAIRLAREAMERNSSNV
ncbi:adenosine 3'-phospho 5'-phosphosulfate transporter 1-like isoform X2 [Ruditapes philippinarum]|uniref:adenosine 3'-phospho 5'-phosphosulfate transporter 1-like isoform X2 n=1 Tax=Ruditapes philippinarum TaxID=129788 RepID=UPI00295B81DE|nr:adenosine 3'-phospho 5'-phosphosulfate transporter 1-like isoform X2 [Ruditapes philippinarum]